MMDESDPAMWYLLGLAIYLVVCGVAGCYVAGEKGRGQAEGFLLAALFGPLGLVVVACLPEGPGMAAIRAEWDRPAAGEDDPAPTRADDEPDWSRLEAPRKPRGAPAEGGPPPIVGRAAKRLMGEVDR